MLPACLYLFLLKNREVESQFSYVLVHCKCSQHLGPCQARARNPQPNQSLPSRLKRPIPSLHHLLYFRMYVIRQPDMSMKLWLRSRHSDLRIRKTTEIEEYVLTSSEDEDGCRVTHAKEYVPEEKKNATCLSVNENKVYSCISLWLCYQLIGIFSYSFNMLHSHIRK